MLKVELGPFCVFFLSVGMKSSLISELPLIFGLEQSLRLKLNCSLWEKQDFDAFQVKGPFYHENYRSKCWFLLSF